MFTARARPSSVRRWRASAAVEIHSDMMRRGRAWRPPNGFWTTCGHAQWMCAVFSTKSQTRLVIPRYHKTWCFPRFGQLHVLDSMHFDYLPTSQAHNALGHHRTSFFRQFTTCARRAPLCSHHACVPPALAARVKSWRQLFADCLALRPNGETEEEKERRRWTLPSPLAEGELRGAAWIPVSNPPPTSTAAADRIPSGPKLSGQPPPRRTGQHCRPPQTPLSTACKRSAVDLAVWHHEHLHIILGNRAPLDDFARVVALIVQARIVEVAGRTQKVETISSMPQPAPIHPRPSC